MSEAEALWPEIEWISDPDLQHSTANTWQLALDKTFIL